MAEYIERTALRDALYADDAITMQGVKILNQFPAADVAPVRHARWAKDKERGWVCTWCGIGVPYSYTGGKYCHECGARMDGGADNG